MEVSLGNAQTDVSDGAETFSVARFDNFSEPGVIPEPSAFVLLGIGALGLLGGYARRRRS